MGSFPCSSRMGLTVFGSSTITCTLHHVSYYKCESSMQIKYVIFVLTFALTIFALSTLSQQGPIISRLTKKCSNGPVFAPNIRLNVLPWISAGSEGSINRSR